MIRKALLPIIIFLFALLIAACASPTALVASTFTPTALPPTATLSPTKTPLPPASTETPVITPTETITPSLLIQHFPIGQEFTITSINMIGETTGWGIGGLLGSSDHVMHTTDGGNTWSDTTPPEMAAIEGDHKVATGFFADTQTAWVTYSNQSGATPSQPVVWRTSDSGATWQASAPLDTTDLTEFYNPSDLQFVGDTGWLLVHVGVGMNHDYVVLFRSQDGGKTWEGIISPVNDTSGIMSCAKTGMLFTDITHGWLTGDCRGVAPGVLLFRTLDGGSTWQKVELPDPGVFANMEMSCGSYDPYFFSNDEGHIGVRCTDYTQDPNTHQYYLFTTADGGNTWSFLPYPGEGLYFFSLEVGWALSKDIQHTTDSGATWTVISHVNWNVVVDFVDEQNGWGVARTGDQIALVKTTDGGAKWAILIPKVGG